MLARLLSFLAAFALVAAPANAQSAADNLVILPSSPPAPPPVEDKDAMSYEQTLKCIYVTMTYGLALYDSRAEDDKERSIPILEMMEPFIYFARRLSGKTEAGILDDLSSRTPDYIAQITAQGERMAVLERLTQECEDLQETSKAKS